MWKNVDSIYSSKLSPKLPTGNGERECLENSVVKGALGSNVIGSCVCGSQCMGESGCESTVCMSSMGTDSFTSDLSHLSRDINSSGSAALSCGTYNTQTYNSFCDNVGVYNNKVLSRSHDAFLNKPFYNEPHIENRLSNSWMNMTDKRNGLQLKYPVSCGIHNSDPQIVTQPYTHTHTNNLDWCESAGQMYTQSQTHTCDHTHTAIPTHTHIHNLQQQQLPIHTNQNPVSLLKNTHINNKHPLNTHTLNTHAHNIPTHNAATHNTHTYDTHLPLKHKYENNENINTHTHTGTHRYTDTHAHTDIHTHTKDLFDHNNTKDHSNIVEDLESLSKNRTSNLNFKVKSETETGNESDFFGGKFGEISENEDDIPPANKVFMKGFSLTLDLENYIDDMSNVDQDDEYCDDLVATECDFKESRNNNIYQEYNDSNYDMLPNNFSTSFYGESLANCIISILDNKEDIMIGNNKNQDKLANFNHRNKNSTMCKYNSANKSAADKTAGLLFDDDINKFDGLFVEGMNKNVNSACFNLSLVDKYNKSDDSPAYASTHVCTPTNTHKDGGTEECISQDDDFMFAETDMYNTNSQAYTPLTHTHSNNRNEHAHSISGNTHIPTHIASHAYPHNSVQTHTLMHQKEQNDTTIADETISQSCHSFIENADKPVITCESFVQLTKAIYNKFFPANADINVSHIISNILSNFQIKIDQTNEPSLGALLHNEGLCKPCVFANKNNKNCRNGQLCYFCHHPHKEKRRRNKRKTQQKRSLGGPALCQGTHTHVHTYGRAHPNSQSSPSASSNATLKTLPNEVREELNVKSLHKKHNSPNTNLPTMDKSSNCFLHCLDLKPPPSAQNSVSPKNVRNNLAASMPSFPLKTEEKLHFYDNSSTKMKYNWLTNECNADTVRSAEMSDPLQTDFVFSQFLCDDMIGENMHSDPCQQVSLNDSFKRPHKNTNKPTISHANTCTRALKTTVNALSHNTNTHTSTAHD